MTPYQYGPWTKADARVHLLRLIETIGPGFHWETPMADYVTASGAPSFTPDQCAAFARIMNKARDTLGGEEFESIANDACRGLLGTDEGGQT